MADIFHHFPISGSSNKIFECFATTSGLNAWWCETSVGQAALGARFDLNFGPGYAWVAEITKYNPIHEIEFTFHESDPDWNGTKVGVSLVEEKKLTMVHFYHEGWREINAHFKISTYCWAMYLRLLKRFVEHNETVAYSERLRV